MNRHYYERMQEKLNQLKEAGRPEPIRSDGAGALDLGPRDLRRDEEKPDMIVPPATDHGLLPNLRFSFSDTHIFSAIYGRWLPHNRDDEPLWLFDRYCFFIRLCSAEK